MDDGSTVRAFVGVPLDEDVRGHALRIASRLRRELGERAVKWEPRQNVHVTLAFLGDVGLDRLGGIERALEEALRGSRRFELSLGASTWFPGRGAARVFVVEVAAGRDELCSLQERVAGALEPLGFAPDSRPFRAHATIGRVRRSQKVGAGAAAAACDEGPKVGPSPTMAVSEVVLFRSSLSPEGATYSRLATVELAP